MSEPALQPSNHQIIGHLPAKRAKAGVAYAEGVSVVEEALRGAWRCEVIFAEAGFADSKEAQALLRDAKRKNVRVLRASAKAMEKLSDCATAPAIGAIMRPPEVVLQELPERLLVLDRLADPGNVGTLIRSAVAFGFTTVLTSGGVKVTNEKMVRSSAGICFREGAVFGGIAAGELKEALVARQAQVLVLDAAGKATLPELMWDRERAVALVLGNEAGGVEMGLWGAGVLVRIPMRAGVESLNVAVSGAIALYELNR